MIRKLLVVIVAVSPMLMLHSAESQTWLLQTVSADLPYGIRAEVEQVEKYRDVLVDEETFLSFVYRFSEYFSFRGGHRILNFRSSRHKSMKSEQRPIFDLHFTSPEFYTLKLDYRSRFEWRIYNHTDGRMRYRERFRLKTSWNMTQFELSPYASVELFFDDKPGRSAGDTFDCTRSAAGCSFKPIPSLPALSGNLYFMVQHSWNENEDNWHPINVYGFDLFYRF